MSHFSILVVGNVDYNMAPFHEFESDGFNDEFIETIDETEGMKKDFAQAMERQKTEPDAQYGFKGSTFREFIEDYHEIHIVNVFKGEEVDIDGDHKFGYAIPVAGTEDDFKVYRRTNPNSFYDYYGEGYRGLKLKKPVMMQNWKTGEEEETFYTNSARKGDIDFEGKWAEQEQKAREEYRKVINALGYVPSLEHTWESMIPKFAPRDGSEPVMTKEEAVAIYDAQKAVKDFEKLINDNVLDRFELGIFRNVDDFCMTEDEYVASQHIHALTFGYVINREYHSNGNMGWWAMVSDEKDPNAWDKEYKNFIDSLDDDALLTILDCHV